MVVDNTTRFIGYSGGDADFYARFWGIWFSFDTYMDDVSDLTIHLNPKIKVLYVESENSEDYVNAMKQQLFNIKIQ